jgi:arabinose-5-phosphate isomerase
MQLSSRIGSVFVQACHLLLACQGKVVLTGIGKSGHIAGKLAATFASTGTPAFFLHPAEAGHGDLGMLGASDIVLALSYSGQASEILNMLPRIKRLGLPLIAMTGNPDSMLARAADVHLNVQVPQEACLLGLAPTSSTTATLAMGDALAMSLLSARGFTREDFANSHPGGNLGKQLLLRVSDIMHHGESVPRVQSGTRITDALLEMSSKGLGMTAILSEERLIGVFTDGDLRRTVDRGYDLRATPIELAMTRSCRTIRPEVLVMEALREMQTHRINGFLVVNAQEQLVGAFNMMDVIRAGII